MRNNISINELLKGLPNCECGRDHIVSIDDIIIENGAINNVGELLNSYNFKNLFLVYDNNTYDICNSRLREIFSKYDFNISSMTYSREKELTPDERSIAEFIVNFDPNSDVIVAVGSGVINDVCKYMAYKLNLPYIIIATAPSMDGYASNVSALTINNLKITYTTTLPKAIIGDVEILRNAPMELILSGFGDIVGKYSALKDWRLANIVNDEYICENIYSLVDYSVNNVVNNAIGMKDRTEEGIKSLMESLVLTGIGMAFVGNSRPASGSEHHLSHYIEIQSLFDDIEIPLHGTKVACGTIVTQKLREKIIAENKDFLVNKDNPFDEILWRKEVISKYKGAAPEVLSLNDNNDVLSLNKRNIRLDTINSKRSKIVELLSSGPSSEEIIDIYNKIDLDYGYSFISKETLEDAILYAKDLRDRYTITHFLWDLNLLSDYSKDISNDYF